MNIEECYRDLGGQYKSVLARFRTEERVQKFLIKFLEDHSFQDLENSLQQGCTEDAFRAAHTLKGVAQNLGFDRLSESSHLLTESLRNGDLLHANTLFPQVSEDYNNTISAIKQFNAS